MPPLIKLLGAIAFLLASGSALALEHSIFSLIPVAEPADWMPMCGAVILISIARRRRLPMKTNLGSADLAGPRHSPNGTVAKHKRHNAATVACCSG